MAYDPLSEIHSVLSNTLGSLWHVNPTHPTSPVAPEVAGEITRQLEASRDKDSPGASVPLGARLPTRGIFEDHWDARPTQDHPWPVILIHGTTDSKGAWQSLGEALRADGWACFAPDYGHRGTVALKHSVAQLDAYIHAVLTVTNTEKVILVGHSQGGLLARLWLAGPGRGKVKHIICLGAPNHGTTQGGILSPLLATRLQEQVMRAMIDSYFGPAGQEQVSGSPIFTELHDLGEVDPEVTYTCIASKQDSVVVPPETCFLDPAAGNVDNVYIQDFDRRAVVLHPDMPMDRRVRAITRAVLSSLPL